MEEAKKQFLDTLDQSTNILVTVRSNPSIDQLAACIALTLLLNELGKRATAVFSGEVPAVLEFLDPQKTLQPNTDSLQDFIISLDKSKADKLRYKVEDNSVKIFITPYKAALTKKDLEFEAGDFNVEMVIALGVHVQDDIDHAITVHGRILHDASVSILNVEDGVAEDLGNINWLDENSGSLSEMITNASDDLVGVQTEALDNQVATALLTGIVAATNHFGNSRTKPETMQAAAKLLAAGANQELIARKLAGSLPPSPEADTAADSIMNDGPKGDEPGPQGDAPGNADARDETAQDEAAQTEGDDDRNGDGEEQPQTMGGEASEPEARPAGRGRRGRRHGSRSHRSADRAGNDKADDDSGKASGQDEDAGEKLEVRVVKASDMTADAADDGAKEGENAIDAVEITHADGHGQDAAEATEVSVPVSEVQVHDEPAETAKEDPASALTFEETPLPPAIPVIEAETEAKSEEETKAETKEEPKDEPAAEAKTESTPGAGQGLGLDVSPEPAADPGPAQPVTADNGDQPISQPGMEEVAPLMGIGATEPQAFDPNLISVPASIPVSPAEAAAREQPTPAASEQPATASAAPANDEQALMAMLGQIPASVTGDGAPAPAPVPEAAPVPAPADQPEEEPIQPLRDQNGFLGEPPLHEKKQNAAKDSTAPVDASLDATKFAITPPTMGGSLTANHDDTVPEAPADPLSSPGPGDQTAMSMKHNQSSFIEQPAKNDDNERPSGGTNSGQAPTLIHHGGKKVLEPIAHDTAEGGLGSAGSGMPTFNPGPDALAAAPAAGQPAAPAQPAGPRQALEAALGAYQNLPANQPQPGVPVQQNFSPQVQPQLQPQPQPAQFGTQPQPPQFVPQPQMFTPPPPPSSPPPFGPPPQGAAAGASFGGPDPTLEALHLTGSDDGQPSFSPPPSGPAQPVGAAPAQQPANPYAQ